MTFIHEDFLLETERARDLFHSFAEPLPIIDYHCHIPVKDIAENRRFENLTRIWLEGDHYKWRAMRACGVPERFITGDVSDRDKFQKWAETVPKTLRNPLYHWTHLELKRPFGIADRLLGPETAAGVWDECNAMLATPDFAVQGIQRRMGVEAVCTTDDPVDDLRYHRALGGRTKSGTRVYPAFRPDRAIAVDHPEDFRKYVAALAAAADIDIRSFDDFLAALRKRHEFFHATGCRLSDHGLETMFVEPYMESEIRKAFGALLAGKAVAPYRAFQFKSAMLYEFAVMDWEKGWTQQFHLGALRGTNTRMLRTLGPDTGYDSIGDFEIARPLALFLDRLDSENKLARTIIYNLNPRDNALVASMTGNFQDGTVPGKVQYGAAWWFLDQADGMTKQIEALSNMGILGLFVGMLTDSRSILSYPRHEYFRRLLCNIFGNDIARGRVPDDRELVGGMIRDICYFNAKRYFAFPEEGPHGA
jgi:glucuronate isomerase